MTFVLKISDRFLQVYIHDVTSVAIIRAINSRPAGTLRYLVQDYITYNGKRLHDNDIVRRDSISQRGWPNVSRCRR